MIFTAIAIEKKIRISTQVDATFSIRVSYVSHFHKARRRNDHHRADAGFTKTALCAAAISAGADSHLQNVRLRRAVQSSDWTVDERQLRGVVVEAQGSLFVYLIVAAGVTIYERLVHA